MRASPAVVRSMQVLVRGRVLLVEDHDHVRELLESVLMQHGFAVAAYGTAEGALRHRGQFDLLITDAELPGLDGSALAREFRRRMPTLPVLLMSGDTGHAADLEGLSSHAFLQKPFSARTLVMRVEQLLSA